MTFLGLDSIGAIEKDDMRAIAMRGGPFTESERAGLLQYCESDVLALEHLLTAMLPRIDLTRALVRGRYMAAAAAMEWNGTPIDSNTLAYLKRYWTDIQDDLIAEIDSSFGVFDGRTFKAERWAAYLVRKGLAWPLLDSGRLDLSDDAFRQMARAHPEIAPMRELRSALSEMRLNDLAVGRDNRNRTIFLPFEPAPAATNRATPNSFLVQVFGYVSS